MWRGQGRMKIKVYYDGGQRTISLPQNCHVETVKPMTVELEKTQDEIIAESLRAPIDSLTLEEFCSKYTSFLLILNDDARPTPTPRILSHVLPLIKGKDLGIVVACGTHPPPSEDDIKSIILGEHYESLRSRLKLHDAKGSSFTDMGTTTRGTRVSINSLVRDFDAIIAINSIEPHYFAGFTGGRKSFIPGIARYDTIEANHSMALLEEASIMHLNGNPLHEDLEEAARHVSEAVPTFAVNVVLDGSRRVAGAFAGNIISQLYVGAELARRLYSSAIEQLPDVLISVVHSPLDQTLYQAQKGFENCRHALRPGGIMILVASCHDGIGPTDYAGMMQSGSTVKDLADKFESAKKNYRLGWHKVGSIPGFLLNNQLWMVSRIGLAELARMHVRGFSDLQDAAYEALRLKGPNPRIVIVEDSGNVCPVAVGI